MSSSELPLTTRTANEKVQQLHKEKEELNEKLKVAEQQLKRQSTMASLPSMSSLPLNQQAQNQHDEIPLPKVLEKFKPFHKVESVASREPHLRELEQQFLESKGKDGKVASQLHKEADVLRGHLQSEIKKRLTQKDLIKDSTELQTK